MPSRKTKDLKLRTPKQIDADWRQGCQYGWESINVPTDREIRSLRQSKQEAERAATIAAARADFDDAVDVQTWSRIEAERRRTQTELKAFDQECHELKAMIGRVNAEKAKGQRQAALIKKLQEAIKAWWLKRTEEDRKKANAKELIEKRRRKECSVRNLTKMLCNPTGKLGPSDETSKMEKWKYVWSYKDKKEKIPFWTLYPYVRTVKNARRS